MLHHLKIMLCITCFSLLMHGCGQKGALFLPKQAAQEQQVDKSPTMDVNEKKPSESSKQPE